MLRTEKRRKREGVSGVGCSRGTDGDKSSLAHSSVGVGAVRQGQIRRETTTVSVGVVGKLEAEIGEAE